MKIQVTGEDIQNGTPSDCGRCPVALAVSRALGGVSHERISVTGLSVEVYDTQLKRWKHDVPPSYVGFFIRCFDYGLPVEPFEFELSDEVKL